MAQKQSLYTSKHKIKLASAFLKKKVLLPIILVLLIIGVLGIHEHYDGTSAARNTAVTNHLTHAALAPAPAADNTSNNERKSSQTASSTLDNDVTTPVTAKNTTSFSVDIVSANVNDNNLHIGTLVNGVDSGSCSLTASKSGESNLQLGSSTVQQDVNSYDCGVFNIATSRFPEPGSWQIILTVSSNGLAVSNNKTVGI